MAYIRYGEPLPSGKASASFVIGGPDTILSFNPDSSAIPYAEMVGLLAGKTHAEIRGIVKTRLKLTDEETGVVCERLFEEKKGGEWDKVPG